MNKDGQVLNKDGTFNSVNNNISNDNLGGQVSSAITGGVNILNSGLNMTAQSKAIRIKSPKLQYDQFGRPIFNLGQFAAQTNAIDPSGASLGEIGTGAAQGAAAGASFGPWGAAIGAVVGGTSSAIFGGRRKNIAERRKRLAMNNLRVAQRSYNQSMESYNSRQAARSLYDDTQEMADQRVNNIYGALS